MKFSLVVPAYNKEPTLRATAEAYLTFLKKKYRDDFEVIIVSDGCTDKTDKIAKELAARNRRVVRIPGRKRLGKGGALLLGFRRAKGKVVGFIDADESVPPKEFDKLISELENGADAAIASRRAEGAKITVQQPVARRIASHLFNIYVRLLFGFPFSDTQCGAKVFKKEKLMEVLPKIRSRGFEADVELLWRLIQKGAKIAEVPITWAHSSKATFSLLSGPAMLFNLAMVRKG